jgi:hypothetical protein
MGGIAPAFGVRHGFTIRITGGGGCSRACCAPERHCLAQFHTLGGSYDDTTQRPNEN